MICLVFLKQNPAQDRQTDRQMEDQRSDGIAITTWLSHSCAVLTRDNKIIKPLTANLDSRFAGNEAVSASRR